jgi:hypothetical protein
MARFASKKELSMMQSTSVVSSPFTNESQFQIACLEQDAMNSESTVSLIMGASAQQTRVTVNIAALTDVPMPSEHGQSATRLHQTPSSQHNLTSLTPRAITRMLSYVPTSLRFHACVSTAE